MSELPLENWYSGFRERKKRNPEGGALAGAPFVLGVSEKSIEPRRKQRWRKDAKKVSNALRLRSGQALRVVRQVLKRRGCRDCRGERREKTGSYFAQDDKGERWKKQVLRFAQDDKVKTMTRLKGSQRKSRFANNAAAAQIAAAGQARAPVPTRCVLDERV